MRKYSVNVARIFMVMTLTSFVLATSCRRDQRDVTGPAKTTVRDTSNQTLYYHEEHRPQFHFSPKEKWMNDPNGLVFHEGTYHLFYQYYPEDVVWGPMHWGHATSSNLLQWQHQPIALYPDKNGYIFSGSAVVDHGNTSGLGTDGNDPLVAIYTYHDPEGAKAGSLDHQSQGIAFSNDKGRTWTKYENNPVLQNPGKRDFRDPKVFWHKMSKMWIMSLAVGDHAEFYSSPDLKNWELLSEFGKNAGAHGGVWECPDLIEMNVEGEEDKKWVLLISINPGGPNGGSATQYFVGDFDGKQFSTNQRDVKWLDHGADNYAGVTFNNAPGRKHLFMGWMSNWNYGQEVPTEKWRSAMTLPRELHLKKDTNGYYVTSKVIPDFKELTNLVSEQDSVLLDKTMSIAGDYEMAEVSWKQNISEGIDVKFINDMGEFVLLRLDPGQKQIVFDRMNSGKVDFNDSFAEKVHTLPYDPEDKFVDIRMILDRSSIELFIDDGRYVMTELFFPNRAFTQMQLDPADDILIKDLQIKTVENIWNNE